MSVKLSEIESLICNRKFDLQFVSVWQHTIVSADLSLRYTSILPRCLATHKQQPFLLHCELAFYTLQSVEHTLQMCLQLVFKLKFSFKLPGTKQKTPPPPNTHTSVHAFCWGFIYFTYILTHQIKNYLLTFKKCFD